MVLHARIGTNGNGFGWIVPCLWFNDSAEDAAKFYVSLFSDAAIEQVRYYSDDVAKLSGGKAGSVLVA